MTIGWTYRDYLTSLHLIILQGPYSHQDGFLGYNEICILQIQALDSGTGWTEKWVEDWSAPYMFK